MVICIVLLLLTASCSGNTGTENSTEPAGDINNFTDNTVSTDYVNYNGTTHIMTDEITDESQLSTQPSTITEAETANKNENTTRTQITTTNKNMQTQQKPATTVPQVKPSVPSVSVTSTVCLHKNTVVKGRLPASADNDGYTGDTYCADCNQLLNKGEAIEFISNEKNESFVQYPCPDGTTITVPVGTNVFDYTMEKAGKTASHDFYEIESEIIRLFNEERAGLGISTLNTNESAYYYVKTRAAETQELFSHTRPNGDDFSGVYEDEGIVLCAMAENLVGHVTIQEGDDLAYTIFNAVMNSPSHKSAALDGRYNQMAVAVTYYDGQYYFCQHMYENTVRN